MNNKKEEKRKKVHLKICNIKSRNACDFSVNSIITPSTPLNIQVRPYLPVIPSNTITCGMGWK